MKTIDREFIAVRSYLEIRLPLRFPTLAAPTFDERLSIFFENIHADERDRNGKQEERVALLDDREVGARGAVERSVRWVESEKPIASREERREGRMEEERESEDTRRVSRVGWRRYT
ncbi:hypothetical protein K0M31_004404 [Melipona bicolor]|uniref:Uncharacterized protein n=1 Tax=Melipona bicolor TaxID=60889 RepID=A0AA40FX73_9HYME|nr:hypothetical protein K0M31_004404 [Melipona bicolor]